MLYSLSLSFKFLSHTALWLTARLLNMQKCTYHVVIASMGSFFPFKHKNMCHLLTNKRLVTLRFGWHCCETVAMMLNRWHSTLRNQKRWCQAVPPWFYSRRRDVKLHMWLVNAPFGCHRGQFRTETKTCMYYVQVTMHSSGHFCLFQGFRHPVAPGNYFLVSGNHRLTSLPGYVMLSGNKTIWAGNQFLMGSRISKQMWSHDHVMAVSHSRDSSHQLWSRHSNSNNKCAWLIKKIKLLICNLICLILHFSCCFFNPFDFWIFVLWFFYLFTLVQHRCFEYTFSYILYRAYDFQKNAQLVKNTLISCSGQRCKVKQSLVLLTHSINRASVLMWNPWNVRMTYAIKTGLHFYITKTSGFVSCLYTFCIQLYS